MSFSDPGQLLVSRSFYEVVSCLSRDYMNLFRHEGSRTDSTCASTRCIRWSAARPWRPPGADRVLGPRARRRLARRVGAARPAPLGAACRAARVFPGARRRRRGEDHARAQAAPGGQRGVSAGRPASGRRSSKFDKKLMARLEKKLDRIEQSPSLAIAGAWSSRCGPGARY